jgi:hypothetical protein
MVTPKPKEDRTLVVRLGPGDLAQDVLKHSRETNGQHSTAELELKLGIIGEPCFWGLRGIQSRSLEDSHFVFKAVTASSTVFGRGCVESEGLLC